MFNKHLFKIAFMAMLLFTSPSYPSEQQNPDLKTKTQQPTGSSGTNHSDQCALVEPAVGAALCMCGFLVCNCSPVYCVPAASETGGGFLVWIGAVLCMDFFDKWSAPTRTTQNSLGTAKKQENKTR